MARSVRCWTVALAVLVQPVSLVLPRAEPAFAVEAANAAIEPPGPASAALGRRLDRALAARALRGARIAALVVEREGGRIVYERDPDRSLVPASNLKVLTAIAALSAFGPTHRFVTTLQAPAAPDAEGSVGALYVRGGGDPALTSEQWWRLAADLRARGLRRVRGDLVLDDSLFDRERWHPEWGKVSSRAYHAPNGALSANYGAFEVWAVPGSKAGEPLQVRVDPPVPYLRLVNRGSTGGPGSRRALQVDRVAAGAHEQVKVSGKLPAGGEPKRVARSVADPALYAGSVLRLQLEALGIAVEGGVRRGSVPAEAFTLHEFEGFPLGEIVRRFMKWSNNAIGETLLKGLAVRAGGAPGSTEAGVAAARRELEGLGLDLSDVQLVDGSGLAYGNRVSPRLLVDALRVGTESFGFGPEFVTALPIAASDGTLEKRAEAAEGSVRAKTGLLTRVTGLSGFAKGSDGQDLVFSVLVNGFRGDAESAMTALDTFIAALVSR